MNDPGDPLPAYLDGPLSREDEARLAAYLKARPDELARLAEELRFEDELRAAVEVEMAPANLASYFPASPASPEKKAGSWPGLRLTAWHAAAALVVLATVLALGFRQAAGAPPSVTIHEISGSLSWTGPDGEKRDRISIRDKLPAGTFETIGENSRAVIAYADGTKLALSGSSRASIAEGRQKRIQLQSGDLRADVTPQPHGSPLMIRTSTASIEVLGTVFSLAAEPERTTMNVEEGLVKLKRLADGGSVEVPAYHAVSASLATDGPLRAVPNPAVPREWQWDFSIRPPPEIRGSWQPATDHRPALLKAVPIVVGTDPANDRILVQHGIALREAATRGALPFVMVTPESLLRFRYRSARPAPTVVFLITRPENGGFSGNFEIKLPPGAGVPVEDGWREVSLPVNDIPPLQPWKSSRPAGNGISDLGLRTYWQDVMIEFSAISITPR